MCYDEKQGGALHDFSKAHCFVNTGDGKCQVLHHGAHHAVGISCRCAIRGFAAGRPKISPTLLDHFLDCARRINLHREEVVEPINFGSIFRELLSKGIGKIVCRVCGLMAG